jgi:hypothetical protein
MEMVDQLVEILKPIAERYIGIVIDALSSVGNPGDAIFYCLVGIVSIIALWKLYQGKSRTNSEEMHRIKTIPHTDNQFVETNWGAMVGAMCFLVGGMPFLLGFKLLLFCFIGVGLLIIFFSRIRYEKTNWPAIIFTTALIIAAISISQQIKAKEPWTQRQDIWLSLMGIGLAITFFSLGIKALWIRQNWIYVRARCLDQEVWKGLSDGPDPGKTWYFQLLCEFELKGQTFRVTPSCWRTFATKAGVSRFLKRKISPSGWCQLRANPDNPLQTEIGPNHDANTTLFSPKRWLLLISTTCIVLVVGAAYHYYDLNDLRRETIPNPIVAISAIEATEFEPAWKSGYLFKPDTKKKRNDGSTLLIYSGEIKTPYLSLRLYNIDFESCTKDGRHWLVTDNETLHQTKIKCPEVTLAALNIEQFDIHHDNVYPSYPGSKNLQPDGTVILSARVRIPDQKIGIILPASYSYRSIKRNNDHFTVKRLQ